MAAGTRFVLGVVCAAVSLVSFGMAIAERDPGLIVTPSRRDFGEVGQGDHLDFVARITNNTGKPVVLRGTLSSCTCTVVGGLAGRRLLPRDSVPLRVKWGIGPSRGDVSTTIMVEYETVHAAVIAASTLFTSVTLTASVKPDYYVDSERLVFDASAGDSEVSLWFRANPDRAVKLLAVTSNHRAFTPSVVGSVIGIRFDASAWKSGSLVVPELKLRTTSSAAPELVVPIEIR